MFNENWDNMRCEIIKATFDYVFDKLNKDTELYAHIECEYDEYYIGKGSLYYMHKQNLVTFINNVIESCPDSHYLLARFMDTWKYSGYKMHAAFCYFDLTGLFALCDAPNSDGYYSPGQSLDICILFDMIEPFLKCIENYKRIYVKDNDENEPIYEVFEKTWKESSR